MIRGLAMALGILAFVAQDAGTRVFCYADADLRKDRQNDAILDFVAFWRERLASYKELARLAFRTRHSSRARRRARSISLSSQRNWRGTAPRDTDR